MRVQWIALFKQADKDKNGYLDAQEARTTSFANSFRAMDRDGDGKVTEQEFNAYLDLLQDLQARSRKACVSLVLTDESRGLFDVLDVNRDGRLSVREMRGAAELIAKYGKGKDQITLADLPKSYRFNVPGPANAAADEYATLFISLYGGGSAAPTYREPQARSGFARWHKNRDGDVSAANARQRGAISPDRQRWRRTYRAAEAGIGDAEIARGTQDRGCCLVGPVLHTWRQAARPSLVRSSIDPLQMIIDVTGEPPVTTPLQACQNQEARLVASFPFPIHSPHATIDHFVSLTMSCKGS